MTLAELGDGVVVGMLVAGKITEGNVLERARLNLARTVHPRRIAVQKQANHHLRRVSRLTTAILLRIRGIDGAQIQRRYNVHQKARQVPIGKPIVKRRRKQKSLVHRVRKKVLPHEIKIKQNLLPAISTSLPDLCPTGS